MIDWGRVADLKSDVGADAFEEVVALFLEEVEEAISHLNAAKRADGLPDALHFLKGSALNLGFESFARACAAAEKTCAAAGGAMVQISDLVDCYQQSKRAFLSGATSVAA